MGSFKHETFFEGVFDLIRVEGLQAASLENLARQTGISEKQIRMEFKHEGNLLRLMFLYVKQKLIDRVLAGYDPELSFKKGFELMWNNGVDFYIENAAMTSFFNQFMKSSYITQEIIKESEAQNKPVYDLLVRGQELKLIKPFPPELLLAHVNGAAKEIITRIKLGVMDVQSPWRENSFIMCWDAVKTEHIGESVNS